MFRIEAPVGFFSVDGGLTWRRPFSSSGLRWSTRISYIAIQAYTIGEYDPARDNGDGPGAGTFRYRNTWPEYSIDGGSTWTATEEQYTAGETDPAQDNGDGSTAGTFRSQEALIIRQDCSSPTPINSMQPGELWTGWATVNNPITRTCPGPAGSPFRGGLLATSPSNRPATGPGPSSYTWNVDDGIEPTGDWCVSGRALTDDRSMICRGDGYTYREARRELGFGLGRP